MIMDTAASRGVQWIYEFEVNAEREYQYQASKYLRLYYSGFFFLRPSLAGFFYIVSLWLIDGSGNKSDPEYFVRRKKKKPNSAEWNWLFFAHFDTWLSLSPQTRTCSVSRRFCPYSLIPLKKNWDQWQFVVLNWHDFNERLTMWGC